MTKRAVIKKINDEITLVNDGNECTYYIVCGKERAFMIDTGYGYESPIEIAKGITADKIPLDVINTHGHLDHVYGNVYCEKAYMHPNDFSVCAEHFSKPEKVKICGAAECCPLVPVLGGNVFDLGGLSLEVLELAGHTSGSICILDRKHRILFSGDTLNPYLWAQLSESAPIKKYRENIMEFMAKYGDLFDFHLSGHTDNLIEKKYIYELVGGMDEIIGGKTENDTECMSVQGKAWIHKYGRFEFQQIYYNQKNI